MTCPLTTVFCMSDKIFKILHHSLQNYEPVPAALFYTKKGKVLIL